MIKQAYGHILRIISFGIISCFAINSLYAQTDTCGQCQYGVSCDDTGCYCNDAPPCAPDQTYVQGSGCVTTCASSCGYNECDPYCLNNCIACGAGVAECFSPAGGGSVICKTCPIIVDTYGQGFHLTNTANGVKFTFRPGKEPVQTSWTDPKYSNAWLALDRNGNGTIDDATELFGNLTPQPPGPDPNGYKALAVFDDPKNGGNGNGLIDPGDSVYRSLRVWIDKNHNGISDPGELYTLPEVGIFAIDLHYWSNPFSDQFGNQFRYQSWIFDKAMRASPLTYDVILMLQPTITK